MWLPNPSIFLEISLLKPAMTLMVIIMTASPMATPAVAMVMLGLEERGLSGLMFWKKRRATKKEKLMVGKN